LKNAFDTGKTCLGRVGLNDSYLILNKVQFSLITANTLE